MIEFYEKQVNYIIGHGIFCWGIQESILSLRGWEAICEDGKEWILESDIMEEGVISTKVGLIPHISTV